MIEKTSKFQEITFEFFPQMLKFPYYFHYLRNSNVNN